MFKDHRTIVIMHPWLCTSHSFCPSSHLCFSTWQSHMHFSKPRSGVKIALHSFSLLCKERTAWEIKSQLSAHPSLWVYKIHTSWKFDRFVWMSPSTSCWKILLSPDNWHGIGQGCWTRLLGGLCSGPALWLSSSVIQAKSLKPLPFPLCKIQWIWIFKVRLNSTFL